MRSWSVGIGRLFGSELRVHVSFLFLLGFVWVNESAQLGPAIAGRALALTAIALASVLLHEGIHALLGAVQRLGSASPAGGGLASRVVMLMPIGDVALTDSTLRPKPDIGQELKAALIAPTLNLLLAFVVGSVVLGLMPHVDLRTAPLVTASNLPRSAVWINIMLALLNLLPAYPMDAGRVLRAMFARRMDLVPATRRAVALGQLFALGFILAGMWNGWWMLIGVFLFLAAQMEERSVLFQSVLQQVKLEQVMLTDFAMLSPADTLEDALEKAVHSLQDDFPVVRGGELVGVISRQNIVQALRSEGNASVQSAMKRGFNVAQRTDTLASVFRKLTGPSPSMLSVTDENRLVGIVTLQSLTHNMALLAEQRRGRGED